MPDSVPPDGLWITRKDLQTEQQQLDEEGRDAFSLKATFRTLLKLSDAQLAKPRNRQRTEALLDAAQKLPRRKGYPFTEPSDLASIRRQRPDGPRRYRKRLTAKVLADRIHAAWLGRCAGCLLGKPVEGVLTPELWSFLKTTGQWPMRDYLRLQVPPRLRTRFPTIAPRAADYEGTGMPIDDDLNYTTIGMLIIQKHGADFAPADVVAFWHANIPLGITFTAERVTYRNTLLGITPPASASWRNPYREWIGAQIRADGWAYVTVGQPERAAEFAWRDACVSHVKNGIYGEMCMAAMIAAAPYAPTLIDLIRVGLSEIPRRSRLAADLLRVIDWHREGLSYDEVVAQFHAHYDENTPHGWCHTNANAVICAIGLLWGDEDFGDSICKAVQPGLDTDCNGATVGSILGMRLGTKGLASQWTDRLADTLHTSLPGHGQVAISRMAETTFKLFKKLR